MRQKQLILHIGQTKTGTTSIQHFLHANRQNLEKSNICYALCPGQSTSHRYLFHLINATSINPRETDFGKKQFFNLKSFFPDENFTEIEQYWSFFKSNLFYGLCNISIVSEELLWELGKFYPSSKRNMLEILAKQLHQVVEPENITIIAAVRHHAEWLESWHNQMVKDQFNQMRILPFFERELEYQSFAYGNNLKYWQEIFPKAKFKIVDFKKSLISSRPIGILFLEIAGLLSKVNLDTFHYMVYPDRLQEAIHPMLHAYIIRRKPKASNHLEYRKLIKRANYMAQAMLRMRDLDAKYTILNRKIIDRCNQISSLDSLNQFGITSLISDLNKRRKIPLSLPKEITEHFDQIFNL